jgi:tRNA A-37 threonylcarbamoyl transferase component Bud32
MTSDTEKEHHWSTQIALIRRRFEEALRSGETLEGMDSWLRQVPQHVRPQLHDELQRCQAALTPSSVETQILSPTGMLNRVFPDELLPPAALPRENAVHGCRTFQGMAPQAISALELELQPQSFSDGTLLVRQGEQARGLLLVLRGAVDVVDARTDERIACDGVGSVLGEMSLLTGQPCSAQVRATCDVDALVLSVDGYERLKRDHPELEIALSQLVSDRLGGRRHDALCGKEIGSYRLDHCISRGGMAVVYQANHLDSGEAVALKMLRHRFIYDDQMKGRFDQEAELLADLLHPNIISFREHFLAYRTRFLVLDLCDGSDLLRVLQLHGPMDEATTRAILGQIALGLQYAHQAGVIHRDLKPGNVLVDRRGRIRITDFGLSKLLQSESPDQKAVGTPAYMPPEQFRSDEATASCDWYALGCLAYEMLSGKILFDGSNWMEILDMKRHRVPSATWPEIEASDELRRVIAGALEPLAAKRHLDLDVISEWAEPVGGLFS